MLQPDAKPTQAAAKAPVATDSTGHNLEVGDTVQVDAVVTAVHDGSVNLEVAHGDAKASLTSIHAGAVKHNGRNPRIGAAPQLRTPAVELPAANGGVKPVSRAEFNADPKSESTAGLPTETRKTADKLAAA